MNQNSFRPHTNFWIILGTLAFLILGYIFYLNYYIAGKEERITSTRFRVLDQIGDNIDAKLSSDIKTALNLKEKIEIELDSLKRKTEPDVLVDIINDKLKLVDVNRALHVVGFVNDGIAKVKKQERSKESFYIIYGIESKRTRKSKINNVVIETPYINLLEGAPREDVFDGLILIRDSLVIGNTLNQDVTLTYPDVMDAIVESTQQNESINEESTVKQDIIFSGTAFDIVISNKPYKAFLKPIEVNGDPWYIVGLMEKSNYNETSRSISPMVIISLSLILIFIILALPIIKLKVISKFEDLETGTIINFAISALLGGSLSILFAFFLIQNLSRSHDVDHHLEDLSADIYNSFKREIKDVFSQLHDYDSIYKIPSNLQLKDPKNIFNSKVGKNILNNSEFPNHYPAQYEFADYYYWVNGMGKQSAYLTPFNEFGTMSNLSSRDYFQKKDEWFFTNGETLKFRLESIVSVSSGEVKVAMSMPSENSRDSVVALSSRFYSIINPIIPKDYKFCIIDKSGKVWFHSDIKRNLKENFIAECNEDKRLTAAMYRNIPKAISVNYYNNPYRVHISPMDHLPLYLVTIYNKKAERSFQAQVISLTLLLISFLFFMLFLQSVALLIINRRFQRSYYKKTIMTLTRPMKHQNVSYEYLNKVNISIAILFILCMIWLHDFHAIIAIFIFANVMFVYPHWVLNNNQAQKNVRIWFTAFNVFLLIIINIVGIYIQREGYILVLGFQGAVFALISFFHLSVKRRHSVSQKNYSRNFTLSLVWQLIIFGILPSLKFYEIANNKEIEIQTRHLQIDLMNQRESRNLDIGDYYKRVLKSDSSIVIQERRKNLGIYTEFLKNTSFAPSISAFSILSDSANTDSVYWNKLLTYFRPFYDEYAQENKFLGINTNISAGLEWERTKKDTLLFQYVSLTEDPKRRKLLYNTITSQLPQLLYLKPYSHSQSKAHNTSRWNIYDVLFWIMVFGIVYIFFLLIRFGTRNIYSLHIVEHYAHQTFIGHIHRKLIVGNKLLITRLSPIDKTDGFRQEFSKKYESFTLDWSDMDTVRDSPNKMERKLEEFNEPLEENLVLFIDHFDWGYKNPNILSEKLMMVDRLIKSNDIKLVLISQMNENTISGYYQKLIDQKEGTETEQENYTKLNAAFNHLVSRLEVVRQPVNYKRSCDDEKIYFDMNPDEVNHETLIKQELMATDYLMQVEPAMEDYIQENCNNIYSQNSYPDLIRRLDILAEKYYHGLLDSCSYEEQHVLFDFADDLIVNPRNKKSIFNLLEKGLLIKDYDRLSLFNTSFRKFLQNSMNSAQVNDTELKMTKEPGTWKGYRIMIIIIIVALFIFIAMAKQDFFDNLNKLFILIAGGITAITGILGLLSRQNKKSNE